MTYNTHAMRHAANRRFSSPAMPVMMRLKMLDTPNNVTRNDDSVSCAPCDIANADRCTYRTDKPSPKKKILIQNTTNPWLAKAILLLRFEWGWMLSFAHAQLAA